MSALRSGERSRRRSEESRGAHRLATAVGAINRVRSAGQPEVTIRLPRGRSGPSFARAYVGTYCILHGVDDRTTTEAQLMASELVTNAVAHGRGSTELTIGATRPGAYRIQVTDRGGTLDPAGWSGSGQQREHSVGSWGLNLVETLSSRWGVETTEDRTNVWFEIEPASPDDN